jgi:gas vesicle protein GvpL/GvpF
VNEPTASSATGIYVYGVVTSETPTALFAGVGGVHASEPTTLIRDSGLAAIAGHVRLDEFGEEALPQNLRDAAWLEAKVRAHDEVLAAAVGHTTVVPFRFGAIYESEAHVRAMLAERRDLVDALERLSGAVELGVNAYLDRERLRTRRAAERSVPTEAGSGRAYMQRRQLERALDDEVGSFAGEVAHASHERLASTAEDARLNPVRPAAGVGPGDMVLNGAYLVPVAREKELRAAVAELQERYADDGVLYELTGPWPPYNFVEREQA